MSKDFKFPIIKEKGIFNQSKTEKKRFYEKLTFLCMINRYCKGKEHSEREDIVDRLEFNGDINNWMKKYRKFTPGLNKMELCPNCYELLKKVTTHTGRCPHMAYKSFCHHCPRPCYTSEKRAEIVPIMSYGGKRLLLYHPILTIRHGITTIKSLNFLKKYNKIKENNKVNNKNNNNEM